MSETLERPEKTHVPIWLLIMIPILVAAAYYVGTTVDGGDSQVAAQENGDDQADTNSHDATTEGALTLTEQAKINIGLETVEADLRKVEHVVRVPGTVMPHPNRVALVNTRIEGRVGKLLGNIGDRVTKGQVLAEVQSRRFGNPIPQVSISAPILILACSVREP